MVDDCFSVSLWASDGLASSGVSSEAGAAVVGRDLPRRLNGTRGRRARVVVELGAADVLSAFSSEFFSSPVGGLALDVRKLKRFRARNELRVFFFLAVGDNRI